MKALTISDKENMIMALQDEIRRNDASRYDHRLHGVLLVAQGMTCPDVAQLLGDSPRTVVNWVQRFEAHGLAGLSEGESSGRPRRLSDRQLAKVEVALRLWSVYSAIQAFDCSDVTRVKPLRALSARR